MHKVERVSSLRAAVSAARKERKSIGFVPTMGNLHEGHLELVRTAKRQADFVVVSIYVNPTQFGANEDLDSYPSTPDADARMLAEAGADLLFLPDHDTMYPGGVASQTVVYVPDIGDLHCGMDRPEHFNGVTTVVSRFFNMVQPDVAVFGKKDYQQLTIIRRMVEDLAYPLQIVAVNTVRSEDGLALSSRNRYLTAKQLITANNLRLTLESVAEQLKNASLAADTFDKIEQQAIEQLQDSGFEPQYVAICRQQDLLPPGSKDTQLVVLAAAVLGEARLIDNLEIQL